MEDDLNFFSNERRPQLYCKWKTTSTFYCKWKTISTFFVIGRRPQLVLKLKTPSVFKYRRYFNRRAFVSVCLKKGKTNRFRDYLTLRYFLRRVVSGFYKWKTTSIYCKLKTTSFLKIKSNFFLL